MNWRAVTRCVLKNHASHMMLRMDRHLQRDHRQNSLGKSLGFYIVTVPTLIRMVPKESQVII